MLKEIESQTLPIIIKGIVSILGVIISVIGAYVINFVKLKNNELIKNTGIAKYNSYKVLALDTWNIVDEYFRVHTSLANVNDNKVNMFNDELKKKCPDLSQEEIDFLRQAIAGEINKLKSVIGSPISSSTINN